MADPSSEGLNTPMFAPQRPFNGMGGSASGDTRRSSFPPPLAIQQHALPNSSNYQSPGLNQPSFSQSILHGQHAPSQGLLPFQTQACHYPPLGESRYSSAQDRYGIPFGNHTFSLPPTNCRVPPRMCSPFSSAPDVAYGPTPDTTQTSPMFPASSSAPEQHFVPELTPPKDNRGKAILELCRDPHVCPLCFHVCVRKASVRNHMERVHRISRKHVMLRDIHKRSYYQAQGIDTTFRGYDDNNNTIMGATEYTAVAQEAETGFPVDEEHATSADFESPALKRAKRKGSLTGQAQVHMRQGDDVEQDDNQSNLEHLSQPDPASLGASVARNAGFDMKTVEAHLARIRVKGHLSSIDMMTKIARTALERLNECDRAIVIQAYITNSEVGGERNKDAVIVSLELAESRQGDATASHPDAETDNMKKDNEIHASKEVEAPKLVRRSPSQSHKRKHATE